MKRVAFAGLLLVIGLPASTLLGAAPSVLSGPIINPQNGHSYYLLDQATWTDSQSAAESLGGDLVTINDQNENDWVYDSFHFFEGVDRHLWIGFNDVSSPGVFSWVSGEAVWFVNWSPFGGGITPNDDFFGRYEESYGHMWREAPSLGYPDRVGGYWNDIVNDPFNQLNLDADLAPFNGVVEVPYIIPEPTSLALATILLGLQASVRMRSE